MGRTADDMNSKATFEHSPSAYGNDNFHASPTSVRDSHGEASSPRKRRRSLSPIDTSAPPVSKKGRACIACRKLKVKCDSTERGSTGCSRCQRLGLECISARRPLLSLDDNELTHPAITRLDRAVEVILQKLKLPPLETYSRSAAGDAKSHLENNSDFQVTREQSKEPTDVNSIGPVPMGSLYEVTQLNSLRSRLRKSNPNQIHSWRSPEHDLIAQKLISSEDAEEMFTLYKTSLARYLFAATIPDNTSLTTLRESSPLLFTAVMLVSALHIPGKEDVHKTCHKHFLELISRSMFGRFHTLDDIRGLCIAAFWQPDLSWKLSGLCIRMATELNLHQAFYSAFYVKGISEEQRKVALEKARIWYLLYVLDHHFSIAYGRPPVTAELLPVKEYDVFINSPWCTPSDRRLISQVSIFVTLSKAFEVFGLEAERLMDSDDVSLLMHLRFTEDIRAWHERWRDFVLPDKYVAEYPSKGVHIHYHFSSLVLSSLALRGRPLESISTLPPSLRPIALNAIEAAHSILQFFLEEPSYHDSLVGIPLYLHSMIAFAVVFLIKLSHRWHAIGITIDAERRTKPLIQGIITTLRNCKAGANHMVYSMASGFERMLKTDWNRDESNVAKPQWNRKHVHNNAEEAGQSQKIYEGERGQSHSREQPRVSNTSSLDASQKRHYIDGTGFHRSQRGERNMIFNTLPPQPPRSSTFTTNNQETNYEGYLGSRHKNTNADNDNVNNHSSSTPRISYTGNTNYRDQSHVHDTDHAHGTGNSISIPLENDDLLWSAGLGYDLLHTNGQDLTLGDFAPGLGVLGFYDAHHQEQHPLSTSAAAGGGSSSGGGGNKGNARD